MTQRRWLVQPMLAMAFAGASILNAETDVVSKAMHDELARSMKKLQLENLEKPYFIAYTVMETETRGANATFGSITNSYENRYRQLKVEVRVGDYKLDNTNFFSYSFGGNGVVRFAGFQQLPLDDNYDEIRRQLWLATDGAYKKALEDIAKKRAALENRNRTDEVPDFSREKPATLSETMPAAALTRAAAEDLARELSAVFRKSPAIFESNSLVTGSNSVTRYVNSEGTEYAARRSRMTVSVSASTQAADGESLSDSFTIHVHSIGELPPRAEIVSRAQNLAETLDKLRKAALAERYSGPVLFEGEAAARLFAQRFAPHLAGTPKIIVDNPQFQQFFAADEESLVERIGARVLPDYLTVVDNPEISEYDHKPLAGDCKFDDDGVPARRMVVIENGILQTVLTGRAPVVGVLQSTGSRHGGVVAPSNLIVSSSKALEPAALRAELLRIAKQRGKDYAIVVRQVAGGDNGSGGMAQNPQRAQSGVRALVALKVHPDGAEEMIRDATIGGLDLAAFKDIVAVSNTAAVNSANFVSRANPFDPPLSEPSIVSYVVPSLLFEDLTVQKAQENFPKPPILERPLFAEK